MLQRNCAPAEIMEMIPVLTLEEIQVIQQYVRDNHDAVMEQDRRIREREANRVTPPEILKIREEGRARRLALMEQFAKKKPSRIFHERQNEKSRQSNRRLSPLSRPVEGNQRLRD
jgi:hypothetical protein